MKKNIVILVLMFLAVVAVMRNSENYQKYERAVEQLERANAECEGWLELMEVKDAMIEDYENQLIDLTGDAEYCDSTVYDREIVAWHNIQTAIYGCSEYDIDGEYAE